MHVAVTSHFVNRLAVADRSLTVSHREGRIDGAQVARDQAIGGTVRGKRTDRPGRDDDGVSRAQRSGRVNRHRLGDTTVEPLSAAEVQRSSPQEGHQRGGVQAAEQFIPAGEVGQCLRPSGSHIGCDGGDLDTTSCAGCGIGVEQLTQVREECRPVRDRLTTEQAAQVEELRRGKGLRIRLGEVDDVAGGDRGSVDRPGRGADCEVHGVEHAFLGQCRGNGGGDDASHPATFQHQRDASSVIVVRRAQTLGDDVRDGKALHLRR